MGSGSKGPYSPVISSSIEGVGVGHVSSDAAKKASFSQMHARIESWAKRMQDKLVGRERRRFNTACIAVDTSTGKAFFGRNHGIESDGSNKNSLLFGDSTSDGILPKKSLNGYPVGNCAEVHAVNTALNAGASLSSLQLMTIHVTKKSFGKLKPACENCTVSFKGRIMGNYSGWLS